MIIPNKFLKLDYNPTYDVLFVEWPNMHDYTMPEVSYIIDEVIDAVRSYDVKRILTDTRQSKVTVPLEEYAKVVNQLALQLATTRLQKFAKLNTRDADREAISSNAAALVVGSVAYRSFDNIDEAIAWLTESL
ncbi:hypothetical protein [Pontibacter amylolyticus]|uniref:STAS/SEC14 domain-containing protein n=1 Tax=Pontibacter amylolyticus TaxID=1424080 RepID=A0ABQ1W671_9BACT|nr:hypothetical protein [Pontibacter amylolyticus]GGG16152.1 hypothetical protein GCM10011323_20620 [Pontibacter amylolyticus]